MKRTEGSGSWRIENRKQVFFKKSFSPLDFSLPETLLTGLCEDEKREEWTYLARIRSSLELLELIIFIRPNLSKVDNVSKNWRSIMD
jgi:hypothetical protein